MSKEMRTVAARKERIIHIETDLGIINIWLRLHDKHGRRVERVEMIPNNYAGEPKVGVVGRNRFIEMKTNPKLKTKKKHKCIRCGCTGNNVTLGPDPYNADVNQDYKRVWECEDCRYQRTMDI